MKKEAIVTIAIIMIIFFVEYITKNYTEKVFSKVENELNLLKEEILDDKNNKEYLIKRTESIKEDWENDNELLSYYLEHDELEKVNTQIVLIKGYLESDSPQDSIPDLEECIFILKHIQEKEAFNLKNDTYVCSEIKYDNVNDIDKMIELGIQYRDNQKYGEALYWFLKAADQKSAKAHLLLGHLYHEKDWINKDYRKSYEHYKTAYSLYSSMDDMSDICKMYIGDVKCQKKDSTMISKR